MDLIKEINDHLPLPVYLTDRLIKTFWKKGIFLDKKEKYNVEIVEDAGLEGGISFVLPIKDSKEVLFVSISYLKIDPNYPLKDKIIEYQKERINFLKKGKI